MLLPPESTGPSKSGDALNRIYALAVSTRIMSNRSRSAPLAIVNVDDSLTMIVAALNDVAMFSATVKVSVEVYDGATTSGFPGPSGGIAALDNQNFDVMS